MAVGCGEATATAMWVASGVGSRSDENRVVSVTACGGRASSGGSAIKDGCEELNVG